MKNSHSLQLFNTQTGGKEAFTIVDKYSMDRVTVYVCGVTPYDYAHLGHARCYVNFDVMQRVLLFWGYAVTLVRNVTDVDDKIVRKAEALGVDPLVVSREYTEAFNADMAALNVSRAEHEPKVSDHIPHIITCIEQLIAQGKAYVAGGDVYFSLDVASDYGELSGRDTQELIAGARIDVVSGKKNPGDFVLWKGNVVGSLWQSPWGPGRPGWHIECSTFIKTYVGETVDIHGGGIDLLFPHHENECAQSRALTGKPLARYWVHNAHVTLNAEKMSKSLGNVFTIRDVLTEFDPMLVRFYLVQHHYRTPLDITKDHIASSARAYMRLVRAFNPDGVLPTVRDCMLIRSAWHDVLHIPQCRAIVDALADDINVPKALGIIFGELETLTGDVAARYAVRLLLQQVFGLNCVPIDTAEKEKTPEIEALIAEREAARSQKNWSRADALRDELATLGYLVVDKK